VTLATSAEPAERNRRVVADFFTAAMSGEIDRALALVDEDHVEHSAVIPPGKAGIAWFLAELAHRTPAPVVTIRHVIADADHVVVHYHNTNDTGGALVADIFRLQDGLITEHWDVVQQLGATT
jgi:predicted SnoaL-like aldol condensation-catalyzing enzyme